MAIFSKVSYNFGKQRYRLIFTVPFPKHILPSPIKQKLIKFFEKAILDVIHVVVNKSFLDCCRFWAFLF